MAQAAPRYRSVFLSYRVYALALPQVRLAAAAETSPEECYPA